MKKIAILFSLMFAMHATAQNVRPAYKAGEWLKFRIHYGFLNASYATLNLTNDSIDDIPVYHVVGRGKTTGFASIFFKVDNTFESYFGRKDGKPYRFIRKTNEGGYTKDIEIDFFYNEDKAILKDNKNGKEFNFSVNDDIQDLISASYYLRNRYSLDEFEVGKSINMDMLFDDDGVYKFKLKFLGKEIIRTKFGKVECLKFRPIVQSGRVFKEKESLTLWVSNDLNKIPIRIKADLAVGSLKADLDGYNGLKNQFKIIMK
ncbi:DUF3108 domain-containing protein [Flagellimonas sp. HMM57]|uniref:DUF3108 domain-containing protein n=1 Tax=unclassified Flagellimonas TaxID=2644544 RepID=UPI0013CFDA5C|nr:MULTISPECIES: DUF3108 domain-containing protein [unclassified Flagellimonas]UII77917.1 DUF3108 domain-containing protein [Flagellimonas sp. HMM57]